MKIYALKDNKLGFMNPMALQNDELAIRAYSNMINANDGSMVSVNCEDFDLYCLGDYNQDSGVITSEVTFLANSVNVKHPARKTKK